MATSPNIEKLKKNGVAGLLGWGVGEEEVEEEEEEEKEQE